MLFTLQIFLGNLHQVRFYKIMFTAGQCSFEVLQEKFRSSGIRYQKDKEAKNSSEVIVYYRLSATQKEFDELNKYLMTSAVITGFEV